ncbi:MAG: helix-turn-helix domain-containing protein [Planctomycetes bacterium]|nr:helix-turn-helix domain-containing protein [Planctomycetota bacterium]
MPYPHQFIRLTDQERKIVSDELRNLNIAGKYKKRRRLQILYLSDQKIEFERIAQRLKCSYNTVRWNIYRYKKHGLKPFIQK